MKTSMPKAWLFAYLLLFLIAIVLCVRLVHEPDLWWQLRTGEYILENKQVPDVDVFSFTYEGKPWLNVKWGFEVIQAGIVKLFGPEFLPLPQVFANVGLLLVLLLIFRIFSSSFTLSRAGKLRVLVLFLIGFSFRMNGRPELTSYLFTAIYIFIFLQYSKGKLKWLWALIPLQMLWANLHEAYGVGLVFMGIFILSNGFDLIKKKTSSQLEWKLFYRSIAVVFLAWLSVSIHPSGFKMLFHPYEIFTQLSLNQFTAEIFPVTQAAYWKLPAIISLLFLILSVHQLFILGRSNGKFTFEQLLKAVPTFYIVLYAALFYLSLKSYRNIPFFLIVAAPFAAARISAIVGKFSSKIQLATTYLLLVAFYLGIVTNVFYDTFLPAEKYGLGINPAKNPIGAARFIADNQLKGPAFTDYLGSSYLLWQLQPDFKTFVDLRDLDVFEAEDMEIAITCCTQPDRMLSTGQAIWDVVDGSYNFNYVSILNNAAYINLHRYLLNGNKYVLVYADELSSVYAKRNDMNEAVISKYGSNDVTIPYRSTLNINPSAASKVVSTLFWPAHEYKNDNEKTFLAKRKAYREYIGLGSAK